MKLIVIIIKEENALSSSLDENYKSDLQIDEKVNVNSRPKQAAVKAEIKRKFTKEEDISWRGKCEKYADYITLSMLMMKNNLIWYKGNLQFLVNAHVLK